MSPEVGNSGDGVLFNSIPVNVKSMSSVYIYTIDYNFLGPSASFLYVQLETDLALCISNFDKLGKSE